MPILSTKFSEYIGIYGIDFSIKYLEEKGIK